MDHEVNAVFYYYDFDKDVIVETVLERIDYEFPPHNQDRYVYSNGSCGAMYTNKIDAILNAISVSYSTIANYGKQILEEEFRIFNLRMLLNKEDNNEV